MAVLIANVKMQPSGTTGGTSAAVDTTGATIISIVTAQDWHGPAITVSDNKGNTYSVRNFAADPGNLIIFTISDVLNPTVGAGHTFTVSSGGASACSLEMLAFIGDTGVTPTSGVGAAGTSGTAFQAGTITPSGNWSVIVSGAGAVGLSSPDVPGTFSVDSGFTLTDQMPYTPPKNYALAAAYFQQPVAANIQPTFTYANSTQGWASCSVAYGGFAPTAGFSKSYVFG